jgi:hypothetical protein
MTFTIRRQASVIEDESGTVQAKLRDTAAGAAVENRVSKTERLQGRNDALLD